MGEVGQERIIVIEEENTTVELTDMEMAGLMAKTEIIEDIMIIILGIIISSKIEIIMIHTIKEEIETTETTITLIDTNIMLL